MKHLLDDGEKKWGVGPIIDRKGIYEITIRWVRLSSLGGSILHRWGQDISDKDQQITSLNSIIDEDNRDFQDKDLIITKYRDRFKQLRLMIEDGYNACEIMELLVAVE